MESKQKLYDEYNISKQNITNENFISHLKIILNIININIIKIDEIISNITHNLSLDQICLLIKSDILNLHINKIINIDDYIKKNNLNIFLPNTYKIKIIIFEMIKFQILSLLNNIINCYNYNNLLSDINTKITYLNEIHLKKYFDMSGGSLSNNHNNNFYYKYIKYKLLYKYYNLSL